MWRGEDFPPLGNRPQMNLPMMVWEIMGVEIMGVVILGVYYIILEGGWDAIPQRFSPIGNHLNKNPGDEFLYFGVGRIFPP